MDPEDYSELIADLAPAPRTETVAVPEAIGRTTSADVIAHSPVPSFATSAMDGFALDRSAVQAARDVRGDATRELQRDLERQQRELRAKMGDERRRSSRTGRSGAAVGLGGKKRRSTSDALGGMSGSGSATRGEWHSGDMPMPLSDPESPPASSWASRRCAKLPPRPWLYRDDEPDGEVLLLLLFVGRRGVGTGVRPGTCG